MFQIQKFFNSAFMIVAVCIIALFVVNTNGQQSGSSNEVKTALFKEVNMDMQAAKKVQADVLAPRNF
ncbi:MAG: hypothetical protein WAN36_07065, partial [Calditrichia bacterium]